MQIEGFWQVFIVGALGGFAVEALRWWKISQSGNLPPYARSLLFWLLTLVMCLLGGMLAAFQGTAAQQAMAAFNFGASAPLLIGALAQKKEGGNGGGPPLPAAANAGKVREPGHVQFAGPPPARTNVRNFLAFRG